MFEKKQTGKESSDDKDKTTIPEQKEAKEERKRGGAMEGETEDSKGMDPAEGERKRGGHVRRKHGGMVFGKKSEHRPDKRARGGEVTSDLHPESAAGKMSENDFMRGRRTNRDEEGAGKGADKNAKGMG